MRRSPLPVAILAALVLASTAHAKIVSSGAVSDPFTNRTYFSITFDAPPDFYTVDAYDRAADEFQFYISYALPYLETSAPIIVRGGEIHYNSTIAIRDGVGADGGPHSGGWGPVRAEVPYVLTGTIVTFNVPSSVIGDDDGYFWYILDCFRYGTTTSRMYGASVVGSVPTAKSSWSAIKRLYR